MSWFSWLFTLRLCSAALLLLVGSQLGLRLGLQMVQTATCTQWGTPSDQGLFKDGDVVIGGLFSIFYNPAAIDNGFTELPHNKPCTGLEYLPLQYIYAMVFALEEINHSNSLLPGVKLGYHIHDSCALPSWAMQAALSLVGGDSATCDLAAPPEYSSVYGEGIGERTGDQPVPLIIGGSSSITAMILSRILAPLSIPLMSYTASCPCLSDRLQYPNFFRTMPSDIYQARAIAQIAIRLNWTWIGAVIANNDYGHVAIKVFQEETQGAGVCLAFIETLQRENIVMDARRAALTIQASTAKVILIFTWYTDVRELFLQLANINVTDKQFLASEAWSTSGNLLQDPITSKSWGLTTLYEFTISHRPVVSESLTSTVQRQRVPGGTHALHSLLSCSNRDSSPGNISSTCSSPKQIKPIEVLQHLNNLNFTTPQGEMFYFQEGNTPAKYDLVNWQNTPEGSLKVVLIGRVDGFDINLDPSAIQWNTGSNQVPLSLDFLSFNETLGFILATVAVSGVSVTTAVFVVFIYYRQTPMANREEVSAYFPVSR
ncbi:hypothetical protein JOQ06_016924 [Pogonophryne albipinna]|uniref:Receptor ligand binding region domain-containing protein n=1 Tax=Pogonophryne albipinna TaxID=1090488 RepID=A0AAD6FIZ9_9TELE|nr:hypothetical protein JOQ06_016924 [Pogonophryne albipinna]